MSKSIQVLMTGASAALALVCGVAHAETIKKVEKPYVAAPEVPVAPGKTVDEVIAKNPVTTLEPGKSVATQLRKIAAESGWDLSWEVADFQLDRKVEISTDIVKAVEAVIESANGGEVKLRADFYRGNHFIRVTEL